jgi:hypothetical protein
MLPMTILYCLQTLKQKNIFWYFTWQVEARTLKPIWKLMSCLFNGVTHYITTSFLKNVIKIFTPYPMLWTKFFIHFYCYYQDTFITRCIRNTQVKLLIQLHAYLFIIQSIYRIKCYLHTIEILPGFPHHIKGWAGLY